VSRVGIRQVAHLADVAVGTVSHYLNHPERVSQEKARRIRSAIDTLGYIPNNAARQLRMGSSQAVAYIAPDVSNPFFAEIAESVELSASSRGVAVFIANSHGSRQREDTYLEFFEQHGVRGLIFASHEPAEDRLARVRLRGTPSVLLGQPADDSEQPSVSVDDVEGGRLAAAHLVRIGARRLAFVGGPLNVRQIGARLTGASEAVQNAGTATLEIINAMDRTIEGGRRAAQLLLDRPEARRPQGIFASNDLLALGMLQTLFAAGVRVPRDVALVGYDDIEFGAASLVPLTTIRAGHAALGEAVMEVLFAEIEGRPGDDRHRVFQPELVVRESTTGFHKP
jgi:LacI family transcriptional regulator